MGGFFSAIGSIIVVAYYLGAFVSIFVYPRRVGGSMGAYVTAVAHEPSRRNGVPWLAKTVVKVIGWPIVLGLWIRDGQPPSKELYGDAAAERLGIPTSSLDYHTNGFATKWTGP